MSALSVFILVLSFPIVFVVHDAEEVIVQHRWMLAHRESLYLRFPKARPMLDHLSKLNTKAFAIAALEELLVLIVATCYVLVDGIYSTQVWSALFIAFSFHLFVHFGQEAGPRHAWESHSPSDHHDRRSHMPYLRLRLRRGVLRRGHWHFLSA